MASTLRRLTFAVTGIAILMSMPATAAADCNGPDCGPPEVVGAPVIALTIVITLASLVVMAAAEFRRR